MRRPRRRSAVTCWYGSERLRGKDDRRRAKADLRRGIEPQPRYSTGKFLDD